MKLASAEIDVSRQRKLVQRMGASLIKNRPVEVPTTSAGVLQKAAAYLQSIDQNTGKHQVPISYLTKAAGSLASAPPAAQKIEPRRLADDDTAIALRPNSTYQPPNYCSSLASDPKRSWADSDKVAHKVDELRLKGCAAEASLLTAKAKVDDESKTSEDSLKASYANLNCAKSRDVALKYITGQVAGARGDFDDCVEATTVESHLSICLNHYMITTKASVPVGKSIGQCQ